MGCGSSTESGRDHLNEVSREAEAFFPPPKGTPTTGSQTTPDSSQQQQEAPASSSQVISKKKKEAYKPPSFVIKQTKNKAPYVPPAPITATVPPTTTAPSKSPVKARKPSPTTTSTSPKKHKTPVVATTKPSSESVNNPTCVVPKIQTESKKVSSHQANDVGNGGSKHSAAFSASEGSLDSAEAFNFKASEENKEVLGSVERIIGEDRDIYEFIGKSEESIEPPFSEQSNPEDDSDPYQTHDETMDYSSSAVDGTPEPSSASGKRFDELYRLKGVLGTGAFSTVREGFHRNNATRSYAVKCINRKKLSEEDEAALLDEVAILKEMKHVHIIRLYDFFDEPNTYYLIMERMRGGELFDRIVAKAYYNEKEARDTCKIVLEAVAYCHENHVAHRDLKPENLLLLSPEDDSAVKIADFGFAKKVYEHNVLTTQCGTPGYVAPEILEGTPYDERSDMWSVGVILYILLGGYPPFIESTQRDLFRKIRKGEYEFHEEYWGTVSAEAKDLISSLLTVDVNVRLTADEAMENPWIMGDDAKLAKRDLGANLEKFRNFNAKRKFRAAVSTIMAVNKLNSLTEEFFTTLKETPVQAVASSHDNKGMTPT